MHLLIFCSILIKAIPLISAASVNEYKSYKNYSVYVLKGEQRTLLNFKRYLESSEDFKYAVEDGSIFFEPRNGNLEVLVAPHIEKEFEREVRHKKIKSELIFNDFSELIKEEKKNTLKSSSYGWKAYYDVDQIYKYLRSVNKSYPNSTSVVVGGRSYEGRDILGLRIVTPSENRYTKPAVFIESGIHAREWIAPATTTYLINQLLHSDDERIIQLREDFDWHIFPTVNPDGYHYSFTKNRMWRKTRSRSTLTCYGADPNRNWDHNWMKAGASNNPCDFQTYGGSKPFSEIETRTLAQYISNVTNLLAYIGFHADAQMLLLPYSDLKEHYDNYDDLMEIGKTSLEYGARVNGVKYDGLGTAAEILYPASGGSMDWVREALGTQLVYTYELRGTYFHWPPERISEQGEEVTQMMLGLFTKAAELGYY